MIGFTLTVEEAYSRQLQALWNEGFGAELLREMLPRIEAIAQAHYMNVSKRGAAFGGDDGLFAYNSGSLFRDLTKPIIQENRIILESDLPYASQVESRSIALTGDSLLPSKEELYAVLADVLRQLG